MNSSLRKLKFWIFLFFVGILISLVLYRPGIYYYFIYDNNPKYIEFQNNNRDLRVIDGVITFGYNFSYGTGKTIFAKDRFSTFGYGNIDKHIYKLSEEKIAICNSKFLGNCLFSEGEGIKEFLQFLTK